MGTGVSPGRIATGKVTFVFPRGGAPCVSATGDRVVLSVHAPNIRLSPVLRTGSRPVVRHILSPVTLHSAVQARFMPPNGTQRMDSLTTGQ